MNSYKVKLYQMVSEMQEHEAIYAFAFLNRMFGNKVDPDRVTSKEIHIAAIVENVQGLNNSDLSFVATLTGKMPKEQEKAPDNKNAAVSDTSTDNGSTSK